MRSRTARAIAADLGLGAGVEGRLRAIAENPVLNDPVLNYSHLLPIRPPLATAPVGGRIRAVGAGCGALEAVAFADDPMAAEEAGEGGFFEG